MSNRVAKWVNHSPYPVGTWRGWEKCMGEEPTGAVLVYDSYKEARAAIPTEYLAFFRPVRVVVEMPDVGEDVNSVVLT